MFSKFHPSYHSIMSGPHIFISIGKKIHAEWGMQSEINDIKKIHVNILNNIPIIIIGSVPICYSYLKVEHCSS